MENKQSVLLNISKDIHIEVTGEYYKQELDNRGNVIMEDSFEIDEIQSIYKDLFSFAEYCNSKPSGTILEIIEELVLEKINN